VIVREATALFAERGFEATTMQDLAAKVGITAPGLYYHFRSKQSLLFDVLETALRDVIGAIDAAVAAAAGPDGAGGAAAQLRAFTRRHVTFQLGQMAEWAVYGAAFYGSRHLLNALTADQRTHLRDLQHRNLDLLRAILRKGVLAGEFESNDATVTALAIIGIGEYVPTWFKPGGRYSAEQAGQLSADLALRLAGFDRLRARSRR
jgi:AcrR family transcriptional regulator